MAEETKFKIWQVIQSVIAAILVFAITSLSANLGKLNDNVIRHDILLEQFADFQKAGGRYTERDGIIERDSRKAGDARLQHELEQNREIFQEALREVQQHNSEARGWITVIKRNTAIILDNQKKAHTHKRNGK